jgi:hypothetical protein
MEDAADFPLQRELDTYEAHHAELLGRAAGKYALVHGADLAGEYDTEADAVAEGYKLFGNVPFLVKLIEPVQVPRRFISCMSAA